MSFETSAEDQRLLDEKFERDKEFVEKLGADWKAGGGKSLTTGFGVAEIRVSDKGYEILIDREEWPNDYDSMQHFAAKLRDAGVDIIVDSK